MADNVREEEEEDGEDRVVGGGGTMREQDMLLPIANVGRLMKQILPLNAKISKEAKETIQESVSEFVAFITGEASDKCRRERRKTVNGDDVCSALSSLGFDNYALSLRRYLQRYRDLEGDKATAAAASAQNAGSAEGGPRWQEAAPVPVTGQMMSFSGAIIERGSSSNSYNQQF